MEMIKKMSCQKNGCENKTVDYDMYCKECQKKDEELYQQFLNLDNKRIKRDD